MAELVFITGGVKSGKSRLGMERLEALSSQPIILATARRTDEEMNARIDRHIADRPAHWETIECPIQLPQQLRLEQRPVLVDCLGVWLTNLLVETPDSLNANVQELLETLKTRQASTVLISNESGLGVIGADALTRKFVDELGLLNQQIAHMADRVAMVMSGIPIWLKTNSTF